MKEWIFSLRCLHSTGNGAPIECYVSEYVPVEGYNYEDAVNNAKHAFRRLNPSCDLVPSEQIEVLFHKQS